MKRLFMSIIPFFFIANQLHAATLPAVDELEGNSRVEIQTGHKAADVFGHFASECAKGSKVMFLGSIRDSGFVRLTLLSGQEAASYITSDGDGKYPWLLACEGAERFLVEKGYRYGNGEASYSVYKGRALEGIDYAQKMPSTTTVPIPSGVDDTVFALRMANDLSGYGMDFVATNQGRRFEGRIEKTGSVCDTVSVTRYDADGATGIAQSYKVCSGHVYPVGGELAMRDGR